MELHTVCATECIHGTVYMIKYKYLIRHKYTASKNAKMSMAYKQFITDNYISATNLVRMEFKQG